MDKIGSLLPHRHPFLFVDELISISEEEIVGIKTFDDSNSFLTGSFPDFNFVPGAILIESMAQCGGAGIKQLGTIDGLFGLANIHYADFLRGIPYQETVKIVIRNLKLTHRIIKQSGIAYVQEIPALRAEWTCVRLAAT